MVTFIHSSTIVSRVESEKKTTTNSKMNFFVTAVLLAVSIGQLMARPGHTAEEMKMIEQLVMTCMAKEGANEGDLAKMMEFELPTTKAGQCLNACMMEMSGIVSGGGELVHFRPASGN